MITSKKYIWGGIADVGYSREINEDSVFCKDLSEDTSLFIVADGMGSLPSSLQPAIIAIYEIAEKIERLWDSEPEILLENAAIWLRESVMTANKVLGAFAKANQEKYAGFGASLSACLLHNNDFYSVHSGNTRIYLVRRHPQDGLPIIRQLTRDSTKAMELLDDGIINAEQYHTHPDRLILTGGLGKFADPAIQSFDFTLKDGDIILMTSDGIHYALQPDPMAQLITESDNCETAVAALVQASKMERYVDNMSAVMVYLLPEQKPE